MDRKREGSREAGTRNRVEGEHNDRVEVQMARKKDVGMTLFLAFH